MKGPRVSSALASKRNSQNNPPPTKIELPKMASFVKPLKCY
jgi:hypothetical protein